MSDTSRRRLLGIRANLDELDPGIEKIHAACVGTPQERYAETMRETAWEMRGAIERALGNSPDSHDGD